MNIFNFENTIEIYKPQIVKNKKWKPKRGEPIFVWNVSSSLNEPCCVSYFYSIIYGIIRCEDKHGSCIGFTMQLGDYIMPQVVGVDIGCGMLAVNFGVREVDPSELRNWNFLYEAIW